MKRKSRLFSIQKKKNRLLLTVGFFYLLFGLNNLFAQDELLNILEQGSKSNKVIATFKGTRIINSQTIETMKARNLDFRVAHRFGNIGNASGGGVHTLYGFDVSSDIRIAFEYGVTNRLMLGFSRNKIRENLEGFLKYKVLEQTADNKMPVSVTLFTNSTITPEKDPDSIYNNPLHRFTYVFQTIIARKFSPSFSLQLIPSLLHRNFVKDPKDNNDLYSMGVGGRLKITRSTAIIGDYFYNFSNYRKNNAETTFYNPLGLGFELETGGHVFTIMLTNASGIIENEFLPNTTDTWLNGGFKFSFNISRVFKV